MESGKGAYVSRSKFHRRPGAMAMSATPARVLKGKKLPGQWDIIGHSTKSRDCKVDAENNLLLIKGATWTKKYLAFNKRNHKV